MIFMKQNFIEWLEKNKDEYGIKIIENPTEEQKKQIDKDFQDFRDWIKELKDNASK